MYMRVVVCVACNNKGLRTPLATCARVIILRFAFVFYICVANVFLIKYMRVSVVVCVACKNEGFRTLFATRARVIILRFAFVFYICVANIFLIKTMGMVPGENKCKFSNAILPSGVLVYSLPLVLCSLVRNGCEAITAGKDIFVNACNGVGDDN